MKRTIKPLLIVACAATALMLGSAMAAHASPTRPSVCSNSNCHPASSAVVVRAVETANDGISATYLITVSNPYGSAGWAVFSGATKYVADAGASESVMLPVGRSYTVWGVSSGSGNGSGSVQISAAGSPTPPTPPAPPTVPPTNPDPEAKPPAEPSTETSPVVETGKLKIHLERHIRHRRYTLTLVNAETGETITVKGKCSDIVLKDVAYGTYDLKLTVGKNDVRANRRRGESQDQGHHQAWQAAQAPQRQV